MLKITREERNKMGIVILFVFVIMLVVSVVVFVIQNNKPAVNTKVAVSTVQPKQALQNGWKYYDNTQYEFSIAHLTQYSPQESITSIANVEKGIPRDVFNVHFRFDNSATGEIQDAPLEVRVTHQTLDEAVKGRLAIAAEDGPQVAVQSQIIRQESLSVAGHHAIRIDQKDTDKTPGDNRRTVVYTTFVYVEGTKYTYALQTTLLDKGGFDDPIAQTMLATFAIN
jgi:hypothetical protein